MNDLYARKCACILVARTLVCVRELRGILNLDVVLRIPFYSFNIGFLFLQCYLLLGVGARFLE